jgi:hypothetical protein
MDIEINQPRFEGRGFKLQTAGLFSGARLWIDGAIIKGKRGRYEVRDNTGADVTIQLKPRFLDPIPQLDIAGDRLTLARPLTWYEYGWMGLPMVLVLAGGALGAAIGFSAAYSSARIFRSEQSTPVKYLLTGLISIGAAVVFVILALLIQSAIKGGNRR